MRGSGTRGRGSGVLRDRVCCAHHGDMTDWIALQARAADLYDEVLPAITDWEAPTPCSEWTARDVLAHVVDEQMWVPGLLAGGTIAEVAEDLEERLRHLHEASGPKLAEDWRAVRPPVAASWRGTPDDDEVHMSYGLAPAAHYLAQQTFDLAVHAWDLAVSQGLDLRWDPELERAVLEFVRADLADNPAPHLFDPPVPGYDDLDREGPDAGGRGPESRNASGPESGSASGPRQDGSSASDRDIALALTGRDPGAWPTR